MGVEPTDQPLGLLEARVPDLELSVPVHRSDQLAVRTERDRVDLSLLLLVEVAVQVGRFGPLLQLPQANALVVRSGGERLSVRVKGDRGDGFVVALQSGLQLARLRLPDVDFVPGRRGDPLAVPRPGQAAHGVLRPAIGPQLAAVAEVPNLHGRIAGGRRQPLAVGREDNAVDHVAVPHSGDAEDAIHVRRQVGRHVGDEPARFLEEPGRGLQATSLLGLIGPLGLLVRALEGGDRVLLLDRVGPFLLVLLLEGLDFFGGDRLFLRLSREWQ